MNNEIYGLQMQHISKAYQDGREQQVVLRDLNLKVAYGELIAIVGPSGSGKSTFLTIAGGLLTPDQGTVLIHDKEVGALSQKQKTEFRRNHIGFIFQNHQLLPYLTVEEQLYMMTGLNNKSTKDKNKDQKIIQDLLIDLGLEGCKKRYPRNLSGGERQRTAIARAFVNHPDLILADEPTASLDAKRGYQIVEMIRQEVKKYKKAGIIVTHDDRILDLVDKVYYLRDQTLFEV